MELHFTPEEEARITRIATKSGINPEHFVKKAILRLLDDKSDFRSPIPELPVWRLGAIGSFHRRDLYADAL